MIRSILLCTLCGGLLCSQANAQDAATRGPAETSPAKKVDLRTMYEDIEIMRRILQDKLEKLYAARTNATGAMGMMSEWMEADMSGSPGGMDIMSMGSYGEITQSPAVSIDGVYLSDHGIVFTVNFPQRPTSGNHLYPARDLHASACIKCHTSDKQQIEKSFSGLDTNRPKPLSDWEKTRQDILGIKDTNRPDSVLTSLNEVCDPGMISELVWLVLGENGRHFSELPPEERVTVAITLGKPIKKQGSNPIGFLMMGGSMSSAGLGRSPGMGTGDEGGIGGGSGKSSGPMDAFSEYGDLYGGEADPMAESGSAADPGDGQSTYRDYLLLGDLHMKQNKPAHALKAYERALATVAGSVEPTAEKLKDATTKTKLAIFDLHHKLAQAALANDQAEAAKTWVERLIALQKESPSKATPAEEAKRLALPGRLIISAEKTLLDQVGSKITLNEFKTQAKIEHLSLKE